MLLGLAPQCPLLELVGIAAQSLNSLKTEEKGKTKSIYLLSWLAARLLYPSSLGNNLFSKPANEFATSATHIRRSWHCFMDFSFLLSVVPFPSFESRDSEWCPSPLTNAPDSLFLWPCSTPSFQIHPLPGPIISPTPLFHPHPLTGLLVS